MIAPARRDRRRQLSSPVRLAIGLAIAAAIGGCGLALPGAGPPPRLYTLSPKTTFSPDLPRANWQLVIEEPTSPASLDTVRIAVRRQSFELGYYADSAWTDRVPSMIQTLLVESFENSGKIVAVGRQSVGLRADYDLATDIRHFEVAGGEGHPEARVDINAKLIRMPAREIVGFTECNYRTAAAGDTLEQIVAAFDESLGRCMRRIVEYTLRTGKPPRSD